MTEDQSTSGAERKRRPVVTAERLRELLAYDPETGLFTWRAASSNRVKVGAVAGYTLPLGYRDIHVDGRSYRAHRLAFLFMTGTHPVSEIDHIDGRPGNNRWTNLRAASRAQNLWNTGKRSTNTSGFKGVHLHRPSGKWRSRIRVGGVERHIGTFETAEAAARTYAEAAQRLRGEFARWDDFAAQPGTGHLEQAA
jgi:HNH endonuclease/AP2 domain